eukprot:6474028-Amphidinium_carterae.1
MARAKVGRATKTAAMERARTKAKARTLKERGKTKARTRAKVKTKEKERARGKTRARTRAKASERPLMKTTSRSPVVASRYSKGKLAPLVIFHAQGLRMANRTSRIEASTYQLRCIGGFIACSAACVTVCGGCLFESVGCVNRIEVQNCPTHAMLFEAHNLCKRGCIPFFLPVAASFRGEVLQLDAEWPKNPPCFYPLFKVKSQAFSVADPFFALGRDLLSQYCTTCLSGETDAFWCWVWLPEYARRSSGMRGTLISHMRCRQGQYAFYFWAPHKYLLVQLNSSNARL